MKKIYVKPLAEETVMETSCGLMEGTNEHGQMNPGEAWAKRNEVVIEEEDEEELEEAAKNAAPKSFHSNDYLKKVWE